jgi:hypothetical protein
MHLLARTGLSCFSGGKAPAGQDVRRDSMSNVRSLMHAMVLLWLIFTFFLFVGEPPAARIHRSHRVRAASTGRFALMQWLHWVLLLLSAITILAAVAGSQGMSLVP